MADPQHIQWLFEGAESWNRRRQEEPFTPDFSGANLWSKFYLVKKLDFREIPLVSYNLSGANFTRTNFNGVGPTDSVDLRYADLNSANLYRAELAYSILTSANLKSTNFERANLYGARLQKTDLSYANLTNALLIDANLTEANLTDASLNGAILDSANLKDADLRSVNLIGLDYSESRIWEAKLFSESALDSRTSVRIDQNDREIKSTAELISLCKKLSPIRNDERVLYFRGESNKAWKLEPSVMRGKEEADYFPYRDHEADMLLELISKRPEDLADATMALHQWVLAQHYGLKTRLLDVTRNPMVALLGATGGLARPSESGQTVKQIENVDIDGRLHVFSVPKRMIKPYNSDSITVVANLAKLARTEQEYILGKKITANDPTTMLKLYDFSFDKAYQRLYQSIQQERPNFTERIDPRDFLRVFVVEPLHSFERIRAQRGAFLVSAFHTRFESEKVSEWNEGIPIYDHFTFDVPSECKEEIIEELRTIDFTRETLLPGLEETARAITERYES